MSEIVTVPMYEQRDIRTVTVEIRQLHRQGQEMALRYIVEIGRRLTEAKEMLNHGEWGQWVKEELPFSQRTAGNFMRIFEEYGAEQTSFFGAVKSQAFANLSYTKALRLLAIDDETEREAFARSRDVAGMSTRELEQAIRERDEARSRLDELERKAESAEKDAEAQRLRAETAEAAREKAEGDRTSYFHNVKEASEKAEQLRKELTAAKEKVEKEREAAKKAKEKLKALQDNPEVPEAVLENLRKEIREKDAEQLRALEEKAEDLRRRLAVADPDTAVFSTHFDAVQRDFAALQEVHARIRENDPARAVKLKTAVKAVLDKLAGEIEKGW